MAKEYDISEAFREVEEYLIESMIRNMRNHRMTEDDEGLDYAQWQAVQLKNLNEYRRDNEELLGEYFDTINDKIGDAIERANEIGQMDQEVKILEAVRDGYKLPDMEDVASGLSGEFFEINEDRVNAIVKSATDDMERAEYAMLRRADDQYRKIIFDTGAAYSTGALTYDQAVDMATKKFLQSGIDCIEYKDGRRVNIQSYAEMALRTNATRSYLAGEAATRDEWGINTVITNKRGVACPKCTPWLGRVFYDDVYSSLPVPDEKYPRLSSAIAGGFLHPNCKDTYTTFFEGINSEPDPPSEEEQKKAEEQYALEQEQKRNERQKQKYDRMAKNSLDADNQAQYQARADDWAGRDKTFKEEHGNVLEERKQAEMVPGLEEPKVPELKINKIKSSTEANKINAEIPEGYVKAGISFLNKKDNLYEYASKIPELKNYTSVACHTLDGKTFVLDMAGNNNKEDFFPLTIEKMSELIKNSKSYRGGKVRLISCSAGKGENSLAQQLANCMGVKVMAPTETLVVNDLGECFISDNDFLVDLWYDEFDKEKRGKIKQTGYWKTFNPE